MQLVAQSEYGATLTSGHRLVVNLRSREGRPVEVRSCEVIGTHHRNRFTFPSQVTVDDVFVDLIAEGVHQCLASLSDRTEVVSLPSVALEIPGLSLAKVNLMSTKTDDGSLGIILRFKMLLGGVARAFRPELGIEDSVPDYSSHMSALVLTDIVLPLLDLCEVADSGMLKNTSEFADFMDTLIERSRDVRFQAELIKRFVAGAGNANAKPRMNNPDRPRVELASQR
ncbi:hypothetical protein L0664_13520 [Octadecabacter sp. G9-8]|uniref:Uncharacterized protein n=1 Tax=Octadecabacter dasysiphoniae TaxID=2909341 RepID=A0ABS9CY42_9RHOB|nr:hypothetical protein [Octadecabacter dasysiphoniae]MCF2872089.1 hypothetical protein [Octadecabacter dasysiphoniae]